MSCHDRHRLRLVLAAVIALLILACSAAAARAADQIDTVAGSGTGGFGGDGGPATSALLTSPSDIGLLGGGAYLIADTSNNRIRRVGADGTITTVAGPGVPGGPLGDDRLATAALLNQPRGVAALPDGGFLIADTDNNRIRRVDQAGVITTVAGNGTRGVSENFVPATQSGLNAPLGVAALPDGGFLIADTGNNRVRAVVNGVIFTLAGSGTVPGFSGDGGSSTAATLNAPARALALAGGGFLIADTGNNRIRRIDTRGTITTIAGSSVTPGSGGDGGPATAALLNQPEGVAVRADGSIVIADSTNERIREVDVAGTIRTIAGTGTLGLSGDGGLPTAAQLSHPRAVAVDPTRLLIADSFNHRVRAVAPAPVVDPRTDPQPRAPDVIVENAVPIREVPPGIAPPVLGSTAVATPVRGIVLVRRPGTRTFVALASVSGIPLGSEIDVTRGSIRLLFTTGRDGRTASALVSGGRFIVRQPSALDRGQRPGVLVLSGPLVGCRVPAARRGAGLARPRSRRAGAAHFGGAAAPAGIGPRVAASGVSVASASAASAGPVARTAAKKRKRGRRLNVEADGSIKTQGRYGAAIVRGTRWTIVDRCLSDARPGTLVAVSRGLVAVRSFVLRRTVLVPAGRRTLAPARVPAPRRP